jgi:hypothetical protein
MRSLLMSFLAAFNQAAGQSPAAFFMSGWEDIRAEQIFGGYAPPVA